MELIMYRINAFSNQLNGGNPACVVRLNTWQKDETMLAIAKKNGVSETAFFIKKIDLHPEYSLDSVILSSV